MTKKLDVGSWGLFCGDEGRQIVLVDDEPCGPMSARKVMETTTARLLRDRGRIVMAYEHGVACADTVTDRDREWQVRTVPLFSPKSGTIVGVLAGVGSQEIPLRPMPLVGCWEWEIDRQGDGGPTSHRRTYWDRNLFEIYETDPSVGQRHDGYWEAGDWANELLDQTDQMRVNSSIRDGIMEGLTNQLFAFRCLTYNVVTRFGSEHQGRKHLRLIGKVAPIDREDEHIRLQGFSYVAPDDFHDMAFEQDANAARVDDVLRGVMELSAEPMVVVDAHSLDVLMTSPAWRREDFGHIGGLGEIVVEDSTEVQAFVASAVDAQSGDQRSMALHVRRGDGRVTNVRLTATGVMTSENSRDALVRLDVNRP